MIDQNILIRHIEILEEVIKQTKHPLLIEKIGELKRLAVEEFIKWKGFHTS